MRGLSFVTVFLLSLSLFASPKQKGLKIALKVDRANNGFKTDLSKVKLVIKDSSGGQVTREIEINTREEKGDGDQSLIEALKPADAKGIKLLTHSHKVGSDDQWLYLPAMRRVKRLNKGSRRGSFMGSEFSFEDIGSVEVDKFEHKLLKTVKLKKGKAWVVSQVPKNKASGYSKQVVWFDTKKLNPLKVEYFDRKGELLKVAQFRGYKKYKKWWRPTKIVMKNVQTQKTSYLEWQERKIGANLPERLFNSKRLKR